MLFLSELLTYKHKWLQRLSYLTDNVSSLSELKLSLQGTSVTLFSAYDKIEGKLKKKTHFWKSCVKEITECFPTFCDSFT
jgi:hypothetical protein